MQGFLAEFMKFLREYKVIGLAIAVIVGGAVNKLVTALVNDIVMPLLSAAIPSGNWREITLQIGRGELVIGNFIGAVVDFVVIALVVFAFYKFVLKQEKVGRVG